MLQPVAMVTADYACGELERLFLTAERDGVSLLSKIRAGILSLDPGTGRQIIGTSGNGRTTSFAIPNREQAVTFEELKELYRTFSKVHKDALTSLTLDEPDNSDDSNNQEIFDEMLADDRLQSVTSVYTDHTLINYQ